jgi:hypothetical protein
MKERPITFSAPMVRAILQDHKTMTRRIVNMPQIITGGDVPNHDYISCAYIADNQPLKPGFYAWYSEYPEEGVAQLKCPYVPGDRLWVRETYRLYESDLCGGGNNGSFSLPMGAPIYRADMDSAMAEECKPWRSSRFMPRKYSRITLDVGSVRVERLQDITATDIKAEGIREMIEALVAKYEKNWEPQCWLYSEGGPSYCRRCAEKALKESTAEDDFIDGGYSDAAIESDYIECCFTCGKRLETSPQSLDEYFPDENGEYLERPPDAEEVAMIAEYHGFFGDDDRINREVFRVYWDSLNGKRPGCSWEDNPWTWVVEFKRLENAL